jgi:hypothetical protein
MAAALEVSGLNELVLPEPEGKQPEWLDHPAKRKVLRVGRRGMKTRFAFIASLAGHGPGWDTGSPTMHGVLQGGDVVWIAQNYPNLTTVLWREEIVPRMGHLSWVSLNAQRHDVEIPGVGALMLRSGDREAIDSIRGIGKRLGGEIIDEAAWLDLRGALQDVILLALADNDGWLIIMSTTNAGPDGGYDDTGAPQVPSYFNQLCVEIREGKRSDEWVEFTGTAFDNPLLSRKAIDDLIAEYPPDSPKLKQEVYAELLETGVGLALPGITEASHMVPAFSPPEHWNQWLGFDWGYHHPWTLGVYTIDEDGQVYVRESLIGRLNLPEHIDAAVRKVVDPTNLVVYGSPDAWRTRVGEKGKIQGQFTGPTVAEELISLKWRLIPAADARVAGLNNLRRYLYIDPVRPHRPRLLWMDTPGNRACLAQVARMPIDPDNPEDALKVNADAAGRGGDDFYDQLRYAMMSRPLRASALPLPDVQGQSLGYDYDKRRPRERETGEQALQKLLGTPTDARSGRYRVPTRRG